jgi:hypothetical protein
MADSGPGPATVGADASGGEVTATDEGEAPAAPPSPAEVPTFCYREVIDSIQSKKKMVCQRGGHEVSVKRAAPDLLLAGVRSIKESELRKEKKIGDGGFGVVYRGSWNRTVVAIKELSRATEVRSHHPPLTTHHHTAWADADRGSVTSWSRVWKWKRTIRRTSRSLTSSAMRPS